MNYLRPIVCILLLLAIFGISLIAFSIPLNRYISERNISKTKNQTFQNNNLQYRKINHEINLDNANTPVNTNMDFTNVSPIVDQEKKCMPKTNKPYLCSIIIPSNNLHLRHCFLKGKEGEETKAYLEKKYLPSELQNTDSNNKMMDLKKLHSKPETVRKKIKLKLVYEYNVSVKDINDVNTIFSSVLKDISPNNCTYESLLTILSKNLPNFKGNKVIIDPLDVKNGTFTQFMKTNCSSGMKITIIFTKNQNLITGIANKRSFGYDLNIKFCPIIS